MKGAHRRWFETLLDGPPVDGGPIADADRRSRVVTSGELAAMFDESHRIHEDFVGALPSGPAGVRTGLALLERCLSSFAVQVEDELVDSEVLVTRCRVVAKQTGAIGSFPATGAWVTISGTIMTRFADGRARETWLAFDPFGLLAKLDALSPLRRATSGPGDRQ